MSKSFILSKTSNRRRFLLFLSLVILSLLVCIQVLAEAPVVSAITLNESDIVLNRGRSFGLKPTIEPKEATRTKLEWSSSNPEVATVKNGNVKAVADGECDIICTATDDSGTKAVCHVTVLQMIQNLQVKDRNVTIPYAGTVETLVTIKPADATNTTLKWESSDPEICTVDENGKMYGKNPGDCVVTVTTTDGSEKKAEIKAHVNSFGVYIPDNTIFRTGSKNGVHGYMMSPEGYISDYTIKTDGGVITVDGIDWYPAITFLLADPGKDHSKATITRGKETQTVEFDIVDEPAENESGDYYYIINPDDTATITFFKGDTITEIPSEIDGHTVTALGREAFEGKKGKQIVVPDTVKSIGISCFGHCEGLESIQLSSNLEFIGSSAIYDCDDLKSVMIPASVVYMVPGIVDGGDALESILIDEANPYYYIKDGGIIDRRGEVLYCYPIPGTKPDYAILNEVKMIGDCALIDCEGETIVIPENVKYIGANQFMHKLENLELKGAEVIGQNAFNYCGLKSVILPDTLKVIMSDAFGGNDELLEIKIPASVEKIDYNAFGFETVRGRKFIVTKGSYAEKYCEEQKLKYEVIEE